MAHPTLFLDQGCPNAASGPIPKEASGTTEHAARSRGSRRAQMICPQMTQMTQMKKPEAKFMNNY
jgi:hypothetical protein